MRVRSNFIDRTGHIYNRLTVVERATNTKRGQAQWLCKCVCGNEVIVDGVSLRRGNTKSCGCLKAERCGELGRASAFQEGEAACNILFSVYQHGAKKRGFVWDLSKEKFRDLTKQDCFYCGVKPSPYYAPGDVNGAYIGNGIDRVDNTKGYVDGNVVPCCKMCNMAKNDHTLVDFKAWIKRLAERSIENHF